MEQCFDSSSGVVIAASTAEADAELQRLGFRTLLTPVYSDLATDLERDYGYQTVGREWVCQTFFAVRRVPGDHPTHE
jgi:hypothetical protein